MVVITIISLMTAVAIGELSQARKSARDSVRISQMREYEKALAGYFFENGTYPGGNDTYYDSRSVSQWGEFANYLTPKYLKTLPLDPINASCMGCDKWSYHYHGYGNRYIMSTYLETDHSLQTARNVHGAYYSITSGSNCRVRSFWTC